nr:hypothetical protein [Nannocystis exedens]
MLAFAPRGIVGEAAESDEWLIDQAVAEYQAYCAGELRPSVKTREFPSGELQFCGRLEDRSRWTISYVHTAERAVVPLAVGDFGHVFGVLSRLDQADARFEDPRLFPPPSARVGGARYRFLPAQGCSLVGVVQLGKAAVLLSALGERIAVVYVEGRSRVVLDVKSPLGLGEVDVDRMLRFHRPRSASAMVRCGGDTAESLAEVPVEPSPAIQAHHIRIVRGSPIDVGRGPSISEVLRSCFEDIARRAEALKQPGQKLKGKTKLRAVLGALLRLALSNCPNLVGLSGKILAEIKERAPWFEVRIETFADVLNLLRRAKTCLVARDKKERTWRINLEGLADPRSALHVRLCKETTGRLRLHEAAANQRGAPGESGPTGGPGPRERPEADSQVASNSWLRDLLGRQSRSTAEQTTGKSEGAADASVGVGAAEQAARWSTAGAATSGGGAADEVIGGAARNAAPPDPRDSEPRPSANAAESMTADSRTIEEPATAALGQIGGASLVMLLAAMFAVAQVRREAEEVRTAEQAVWEAQRRALTGQLDAFAQERTQLVVLLHQLAGLTVEPAPRHAPIEQDTAATDEPLVLAPDAGDRPDRPRPLGEISSIPAPTATNQVGQQGSLPAHPSRVDEQASLEHEDSSEQVGADQHPTFSIDPAPSATTGTPQASSRPRLDVPGVPVFDDQFIGGAGPAASACPIGRGLLGPRGPPGAKWREPSRSRSSEWCAARPSRGVNLRHQAAGLGRSTKDPRPTTLSARDQVGAVEGRHASACPRRLQPRSRRAAPLPRGARSRRQHRQCGQAPRDHAARPEAPDHQAPHHLAAAGFSGPGLRTVDLAERVVSPGAEVSREGADPNCRGRGPKGAGRPHGAPLSSETPGRPLVRIGIHVHRRGRLALLLTHSVTRRSNEVNFVSEGEPGRVERVVSIGLSIAPWSLAPRAPSRPPILVTPAGL